MKGESSGLIIGISIGVVIGVLLAILALFFIRYHRRRTQIGNSSSRRAATIPIRANGVDSCTVLSDSSVGTESPRTSGQNGMPLWLGVGGLKKANVVSASGILEYSYKDLQKATCNFTTLIGQGAFGPVYKAQMSTGETVAVKVLATDSKQGEKEFQTEVMLLGRLHHRNLVNLVGYCADKGQHMLIYVYMSKGSLASHLYTLDVARGLEYLHDGAIPPVIHRDIKSSNILLDQSMRARAAMNTEGKVGWEEIVDSRLDGKFDVQELNDVAALAYKCVNRAPRKRPSMRDLVQVLSRILKPRHDRNHHRHSLSATPDEVAINVDQLDHRSPMSEHQRLESLDSTADTFDV
ncbi:protein kinase superfamily protein [Actinidia rufa]|uniref:Protein kinase superfamily protein n=1 Tax=Actinidia rufa TaxID=165716 RepID=A0A7J0GNU0_9ERIC|nr:protein kinase superfamily protein [Actinidia rufa]